MSYPAAPSIPASPMAGDPASISIIMAGDPYRPMMVIGTMAIIDSRGSTVVTRAVVSWVWVGTDNYPGRYCCGCTDCGACYREWKKERVKIIVPPGLRTLGRKNQEESKADTYNGYRFHCFHSFFLHSFMVQSNFPLKKFYIQKQFFFTKIDGSSFKLVYIG